MLIDEDSFDTSIAWLDHPPIQNFETMLSCILKPGKSWHEDLQIWGDTDSNEVQVFSENGRIESITIRIDLRKDVGSFKSKIICFAKKVKCLFLFPEFRRMANPDPKALNEAISNSAAARFLDNPKKFLNELSSRE